MRTLLQGSIVFCVTEPLSPDLGITKFASEWRARFGHEPCFLFENVVGYPGARVVMNLFRRDRLLAGLNLPANEFLPLLAQRARESHAAVVHGETLATERRGGLDSLPVLRHQPGDVGPYLTSFVGCLADPEYGGHNLGFYRVLVREQRDGVIFMDPRTDAFRIVERARKNGAAEVPITLFAGGPVAAYAAAAAAIPAHLDSYLAAARIADADLMLDQSRSHPPAPATAEIVLHGRITQELATEAPFGEFKGYYCKATRSPVLVIDEVLTRPDAYVPALFCGKESGLELMSLTNEWLLFDHLHERGLPVSDVRYPLSGFGEFLTLIETPVHHRAHEILENALRFDRRTKLILVGRDLSELFAKLSIFNFDAFSIPYIKRAANHGSRIGVVIQPDDSLQFVEY